jgi:hypothetical protein
LNRARCHLPKKPMRYILRLGLVTTNYEYWSMSMDSGLNNNHHTRSPERKAKGRLHIRDCSPMAYIMETSCACFVSLPRSSVLGLSHDHDLGKARSFHEPLALTSVVILLPSCAPMYTTPPSLPHDSTLNRPILPHLLSLLYSVLHL